MPTIRKFFIENYKGIKSVEIDLDGRSTSPVLTLIGLNESGKTTILEAISHFVSGDKSVSSLFDGPQATSSALGIIPMDKKAAFTGQVKIGAEVILDEDDIQAIKSVAKEHQLDVNEEKLKIPFTIIKLFHFMDSVLSAGYDSFWNIHFYTRTIRSKKPHSQYQRPDKGQGVDVWNLAINVVRDRLQHVSYFPTFLVDLPAKVYLREHDGESAVNRHYRFVFQDILDSLGEDLTLERHVAKRIEDFKKSENSPSWLSLLFGGPSKGPIDSVFQKISSAVTKEIIGSWQRVFQRSISIRSISVDWGVDTDKNDLPWASFHVSDGASKYAINERSLGFRWFFSFLLFTGFKQAKERKTIFIFDEPAANLHAKAQAELLKSFSKIASDGNKIIYSTHSHHMINPRWLGSAYIVENAALDYDQSDNFGLDTKPTNISATPYRRFVSDFPSRSSYFQPVIEKLEYIPPEVVGRQPYLVVEGITDYYALTLAKKINAKSYSFSIIPGAGSGASGPIISQLLGQGQNFTVFLDDDGEGRKAAIKYQEDWFLGANSIKTLADVDTKFSGWALEKLLGQDSIHIIQNLLELSSAPSKKQIGWYLAERCASFLNNTECLSEDALLRLTSVLDFFEVHFSQAA
jgi:predicted ATPase